VASYFLGVVSHELLCGACLYARERRLCRCFWAGFSEFRLIRTSRESDTESGVY
jgi:hypothetical protein